MTDKETESFVSCTNTLSDGWDMKILLPAYQHLPLDDAIHTFCSDLYNYCKMKFERKAELAEAGNRSTVNCESRIQ